MGNIINYIQKNHTQIAKIIAGVFVLVLVLASILPVFGAFTPGETLDPDCLPTDAGCVVTIAASWGAVIGDVADQADLQTALDLKLDADVFTASSTELVTSLFSGKTTDDISEGATNKYYSDSLVDTRINTFTSLENLTTLTNLQSVGTIATGTWNGTAIASGYFDNTGAWIGTFDGQEGSYYLDAQNLNNFSTVFDSNLTGVTADDISEGATNKYYTDTKVNTVLTASTTIVKTHADNIFTGDNTFSGALVFSEFPRKSGSLTPTNDYDLIPKSYADALIVGQSARGSARVVTDEALPAVTYDNGASGAGATLTADANGALPTIDGVTLIVGNRVLVKDQASALQNGIYEVTAVGDVSNPFILTRTDDYDLDSKITNGSFVPITNGTDRANTVWIMTTIGTMTVGTTDINFTQLSISPAAYTASGGVLINSNNFSLDIATSQGLALAGDSLKVDYDNTTIGIVGDKLAALNIETAIINSLPYYASAGKVLSGASGIFTTGTKLGIGTTTPSALLDIYQSVAGESNALAIRNPSSSGSAYSLLQFSHDTAETAGIIFNSSARTTDAGVGGLTFYNDAGGMRFRTDGAFTFANGGSPGTDYLTLTSSGDLGIGTSTPSSALGIYRNGYSVLNAGDSASSGYGYLDLLRQGQIKVHFDTNGTSYINKYDSSTNVFAVDNVNGNIGIGTSTPSYKLDVLGASGLDGSAPVTLQLQSSNNGTWTDESIPAQILFSTLDGTGGAGVRGAIKLFADSTDGADNGLSFYTTSAGSPGITEKMRIDHTGNVGIGTTVPGQKLSVIGGGWSLFGSDTLTTATQKNLRIGLPHYDNATSTLPVTAIYGTTQLNSNLIIVGGGTSGGYAASEIRFYTASDSVTTTGSRRASIDSSGRFFMGSGSALGALTVGESRSFSGMSSSVSGRILGTEAITITDTDQTGTIANRNAVAFRTPTFASTNAVTLTESATLYVANSPTAGTNTTITNGYALWVDSGTTKLDGSLRLPGLSSAGSSYSALCLNTSTGEVLKNTGTQTCTVSSKRFKHDIETLTESNGLEFVQKLRPVSFKLNDTEEERLGFIAEEVYELDSRLVGFEEDGITPRTVRYEEMTAVLAKAIQELDQKISSTTISSGLNIDSVTVTSLVSKALTLLTEWVGEKITVTLGIFKNIETEKIFVENGIEMKDKETGKIYCVQMISGVLESVRGSCKDLEEKVEDVKEVENEDNNDNENNNEENTATTTEEIIDEPEEPITQTPVTEEEQVESEPVVEEPTPEEPVTEEQPQDTVEEQSVVEETPQLEIESEPEPAVEEESVEESVSDPIVE